MVLSRTARILLAILLLAAAAFFWVNFFTQNRLLVEDPAGTAPVAAPPTAQPPTVTLPDGEPAVTGAAAPEGDAIEPAADAADADAADAPEGAATDAAEAEATDAPMVVTPAPSVTVADDPVALTREVVIADLPFLVTSPPAPVVEEDPAAAIDAERSLAAARATINPFSPVVVRTPPAPEREVPAAAAAPPVVTQVAVPTEPGAIPGPRVAAPAPQVVAPTGTAVRDLPRALPTGTPLSATPDIIRQPRVAAPTPVEVVEERVDVTGVATVRLPETPVVSVETVTPQRGAAEVHAPPLEPLGPASPTPPTAAAVPQAPLAAGTNVLARFLRDNGWSFTGSSLGPVSVGVFRSNASATPVVVVLGQTLPDTEIVLTDLRGQQAQLTLGDTSQILGLDLRR